MFLLHAVHKRRVHNLIAKKGNMKEETVQGDRYEEAFTRSLFRTLVELKNCTSGNEFYVQEITNNLDIKRGSHYKNKFKQPTKLPTYRMQKENYNMP